MSINLKNKGRNGTFSDGNCDYEEEHRQPSKLEEIMTLAFFEDDVNMIA